MNDAVRTVRILVEGRVQGVGFRHFALTEASHRAVGGFARNLRDGRVEVVVQGDPDAVAALCEACGRGPYAAHVTRVEIRDFANPPQFDAFEQRPDA